MNEKNWSLWRHAAVTQCKQSKLRDTQLEEWEEVLPSPPMRSDSLRRTLTSSGLLSLGLWTHERNITGPTFIQATAVSLLPPSVGLYSLLSGTDLSKADCSLHGLWLFLYPCMRPWFRLVLAFARVWCGGGTRFSLRSCLELCHHPQRVPVRVNARVCVCVLSDGCCSLRLHTAVK